MEGSSTLVSPNSRLESNKEEEKEAQLWSHPGCSTASQKVVLDMQKASTAIKRYQEVTSLLFSRFSGFLIRLDV